MDKLVSVIIPCYNAEKYIKETMESALNQSYTNIEVIVVDDGSQDKSKNIVSEISSKDKRVKYIYQQNSGVSVARNTGIKASEGELIAFLDSDDIWHKTKLEKQVKSMIFNNLDACYCGYNIWYDSTGEKVEKKMNFISNDLLDAYIKEITMPQTCTWVIKRSVFFDNGIFFFDGCSWGEDIELFVKIMSLCKVGYVEEYLVDYRITEGSLSGQNKISYEDVQMWERVKKWLEEKNISKYEEFIMSIDRYRITRTYIDNFIKEIKSNQDYSIFLDEKKKYLAEVKPRADIRDIKFFIKKLYIKLKLLQNKGK